MKTKCAKKHNRNSNLEVKPEYGGGASGQHKKDIKSDVQMVPNGRGKVVSITQLEAPTEAVEFAKAELIRDQGRIDKLWRQVGQGHPAMHNMVSLTQEQQLCVAHLIASAYFAEKMFEAVEKGVTPSIPPLPAHHIHEFVGNSNLPYRAAIVMAGIPLPVELRDPFRKFLDIRQVLIDFFDLDEGFQRVLFSKRDNRMMLRAAKTNKHKSY